MVVKKSYRFFLPLTDNEGNPFDEESFKQVIREIRERFGGLTYIAPEPEVAWRGEWVDPLTGHIFYDLVTLFYIVADPTVDNDAFFTFYKEELKQRFRQEDILLTAHLVEVF